MAINHKRCPECGNRLKHYYWYCGRCGNQDITNYTATIAVFAVALVIIILGLVIIRDNFCDNELTAQLINQIAPKKLACK